MRERHASDLYRTKKDIAIVRRRPFRKKRRHRPVTRDVAIRDSFHLVLCCALS